MTMIINLIISILSVPAVQSAIAVLIVALIGFLAKKYSWAKKVALAAADAYQYAEDKGYIQGLKAYQKLDPFMDKLNELIWQEFGREPTPKDIGKAVEVMETLVQKEHVGK